MLEVYALPRSPYSKNGRSKLLASHKTIDPADGSIELLKEVAANTGVITFPNDMHVDNGWL
jgi:hypothetical protein